MRYPQTGPVRDDVVDAVTVGEEGGQVGACEYGAALLGAHVLGGLDAGDTRAMEEHLATCERCRAEAADLDDLRAALGEVPPEAFINGSPEGADLLLARTLRAAGTERASRRRTRLLARTVSAAAALAALFLTGLAVGRAGDGDGTVARPPASTTPSPPAGTRDAQGSDPITGARMAVRMEPAAGWVRIHAAVTGIPAGQRCRLVVVGASGTRETAGSWLVSPAGEKDGTTLDGTALVAPDDVAAVLVENFDGTRYVTVRI